jgi:hypothetical protein
MFWTLEISFKTGFTVLVVLYPLISLVTLVFVHTISVQVADMENFETSSEVGPNWHLIGRMLDRMSFLAFAVTYFVLLIVYYLYYL